MQPSHQFILRREAHHFSTVVPGSHCITKGLSAHRADIACPNFMSVVDAQPHRCRSRSTTISTTSLCRKPTSLPCLHWVARILGSLVVAETRRHTVAAGKRSNSDSTRTCYSGQRRGYEVDGPPPATRRTAAQLVPRRRVELVSAPSGTRTAAPSGAK